MKILFIAPIPPPYNGQSIASEAILRHLSVENEILLLNFAKEKNSGFLNFILRVIFILKLYFILIVNKSSIDKVYLTVSESILGNIKDLIFFILIYNKLSVTSIHLHGGAGMIEILNKNKYPILYRLNKFFLNKIKSIIILGKSHINIYSGIVNPEKIFIVSNFADESLFISDKDFKLHKTECSKINILYLSNLIESKGYKYLIEAFISLPSEIRDKFNLNIAGEIRSLDERNYISNITTKFNNVTYHGVVNGLNKQNLFFKSHIFCLPTFYEFEGQPISILEAYASGCFVITTNHSGICDVFENNVNGFFVEKKSITDIRDKLIQVISNLDFVHESSRNNMVIAKRYFTHSIYNSSLNSIILDK